MEQRDDWHLTEQLQYEHGRGDPFAAAVRATRMSMVITDPSQPDNPIVFCNEAFQTLTGYTRDEIIGRNCRFLQGPATDQAMIGRVRDAIASGVSIDIDLLNYRKNGSTFWNALYLSPVKDAAGDIRYFFASQLDVTQRVARHAEIEHEVKKRTLELEKALEAKTLLLHEVDHRVKNNLTMIGSLLRLQARTIDNPDISAKLRTMLERIDALATVHRRLYQSDDITAFDVGNFASNLLTDVIGSSGRNDIKVDTEIVPIEIRSANASAAGLVLNEIFTNAIKHGFADGRSGTLKLRASADGARGTIVVDDDGPGFDTSNVQSGLGHTLIERLSRQIGGNVTWTAGPSGSRVAFTFPTGS